MDIDGSWMTAAPTGEQDVSWPGNRTYVGQGQVSPDRVTEN